MRIKQVDYDNKRCLMIYISQQEEADAKIKELIQNYKNEYHDVVTFISGNCCLKGVLTRVVQDGR